MIKQFDLDRQLEDIGGELKQKALEIIDSGYYSLGPEVENFEGKFSDYIGTKYCVAVNSGTTALQIALESMELDGEQIITTPMTFQATTEAIVRAGYEPKYVDVVTPTGLIDLNAVEKAIDDDTAAVLPVHLYGNTVEIDELKYPVPIIEDAAQAHGAKFKDGEMAGSKGDVGCFSFYPSKNLGSCGEGGAIVTDSKRVYEKAKAIRNHGYIDGEHKLIGSNFKMTEMQAGLLSVKLKHLPEWIENRRRIARRYCFHLKDHWEKTFQEDEMDRHAFHQFVLLDYIGEIQERLDFHDIETRKYYDRSLVAEMANQPEKHFRSAHLIARRNLALPMYPELKENEIRKVANVING